MTSTEYKNCILINGLDEITANYMFLLFESYEKAILEGKKIISDKDFYILFTEISEKRPPFPSLVEEMLKYTIQRINKEYFKEFTSYAEFHDFFKNL